MPSKEQSSAKIGIFKKRLPAEHTHTTADTAAQPPEQLATSLNPTRLGNRPWSVHALVQLQRLVSNRSITGLLAGSSRLLRPAGAEADGHHHGAGRTVQRLMTRLALAGPRPGEAPIRPAAVVAPRIQRNTYDDRVAEARASSNATVQAIAARLAAMEWPAAKPEIRLVAPAEITTTAFYDAATHTIKANRDEPDQAKLWDNILFEAQNAVNQTKFKDATKMKTRATPDTPAGYGRAYAEVEFDSFMKYVTALRATGLRADQLTDLARRALAKADEFATLSRAEAVEAFVSAPHMRGAVGKAGLSSADLYAYEALEAYDLYSMCVKVSAVMKTVFEAHGGLTSTDSQAVRSVFRDAEWPGETETAKRPYTFHTLVIKAITATPHEDMKAQLEKLKLSPAALAVAEAAR